MTEHLIRFVCSAVHEVFSLEIELGLGALGEIAAQRNRRGATGVGGQQPVEFGLKARIIFCFDKSLFKLIQGRNQQLGNELTAELAKNGFNSILMCPLL